MPFGRPRSDEERRQRHKSLYGNTNIPKERQGKGMSATIRKIYKQAGVKTPDGKGIHTEKFHEMAVAIKRDNPKLSMSSCYAIAMKKLGREKAVKKSHQR